MSCVQPREIKYGELSRVFIYYRTHRNDGVSGCQLEQIIIIRYQHSMIPTYVRAYRSFLIACGKTDAGTLTAWIIRCTSWESRPRNERMGSRKILVTVVLHDIVRGQHGEVVIVCNVGLFSISKQLICHFSYFLFGLGGYITKLFTPLLDGLSLTIEYDRYIGTYFAIQTTSVVKYLLIFLR